jgi:hypothetical protein
VTEPSRSGPRPVGPGRPAHPLSMSFCPPPFLEREDHSTLSHCGRRHSQRREPFAREVIHKGERLERREIIREKDRLSPRR